MSVTNMATQLALCRHHAAKRLRVLAVLLAALLIPNLAFLQRPPSRCGTSLAGVWSSKRSLHSPIAS